MKQKIIIFFVMLIVTLSAISTICVYGLTEDEVKSTNKFFRGDNVYTAHARLKTCKGSNCLYGNYLATDSSYYGRYKCVMSETFNVYYSIDALVLTNEQYYNENYGTNYQVDCTVSYIPMSDNFPTTNFLTIGLMGINSTSYTGYMEHSPALTKYSDDFPYLPRSYYEFYLT